MSIYWNLKRKTDKNYIVIQHPLKIQRNVSLCGIKFCAGYGVVVENSKEYRDLKKIPMFKKVKELPLSFLKSAGFRLKDVQLVFGNDIYYHYLDAVGLGKDLKPIEPVVKEVEQPFVDVKVAELIEQSKEELDVLSDNPVVAERLLEDERYPALTTDDIINVHKQDGLCIHVKSDGTVCENKKSIASPSGYCFGHVRHDPERLGSREEE